MQRVVIRLKGHLDENWSEWLEGFTLTHTAQGETVLLGMVKDQAALYGLIAKLRDLGVNLLMVEIRDAEDGAPKRIIGLHRNYN